MCLAENPNTPDDVLRVLATRDDEWARYIAAALQRNPRYRQDFGANAAHDAAPAATDDGRDPR
jgi:hypothetical protein